MSPIAILLFDLNARGSVASTRSNMRRDVDVRQEGAEIRTL